VSKGKKWGHVDDSRVQQKNISDVCAAMICARRRSLSVASCCPLCRVTLT